MLERGLQQSILLPTAVREMRRSNLPFELVTTSSIHFSFCSLLMARLQRCYPPTNCGYMISFVKPQAEMLTTEVLKCLQRGFDPLHLALNSTSRRYTAQRRRGKGSPEI